MASLINDDDVYIEEKDELLKEIASFCAKLFQAIGNNPKVLEARCDFCNTLQLRPQKHKKQTLREYLLKQRLVRSSKHYQKGKLLALMG